MRNFQFDLLIYSTIVIDSNGLWFQWMDSKQWINQKESNFDNWHEKPFHASESRWKSMNLFDSILRIVQLRDLYAMIGNNFLSQFTLHIYYGTFWFNQSFRQGKKKVLHTIAEACTSPDKSRTENENKMKSHQQKTENRIIHIFPYLSAFAKRTIWRKKQHCVARLLARDYKYNWVHFAIKIESLLMLQLWALSS